MSSSALSASMSLYVWILVAFTAARLLLFRYKNGFSKYNGPFLASFTDLWRVFNAYLNRDSPPPMFDTHQKYGDIIRVGPNVILFAKPEAIKDIYGAGKGWKKSGFYPVQQAVVNGEITRTMFSTDDKPYHNALRKAINPYFTNTATTNYEHSIVKTVDIFLEQWNAKFVGKKSSDGIIDLADWFLFFAFDVIGELTYGSMHGFMESGSDSQGIFSFVQKHSNYGSVMGLWPFGNKFLRHNPVLLWLEKKGLYHAATFPLGPAVAKRHKARFNEYSTKKEVETASAKDLLDNFLAAKEKYPTFMTNKEILGLSLVMVFAGAETTGSTLTALFYFALKNPACYAKLQHEIDTKLPARDGSSLQCDVDFATAYKLPYLHASVQETFRLNPPSAVNLERIVPPGGANIAGEPIPGGTVVGVTPWAIHRNEKIFGHHPREFRPERWLEASEEKVRLMENTMLHFGAGNHICLGKHISEREIYICAANLMRIFSIELLNPEEDCTISTNVGVRRGNIKVRIARRT